jgi:hypothetical protein
LGRLGSISPPKSEADPIWVESKWGAAQLDGQAIEFRLPLKGGGIVHGIGQLSARTRKVVDDRIAVQIHVEVPIERWRKRQTGFLLSQSEVDQIEIHPEQDISKFRLMTI